MKDPRAFESLPLRPEILEAVRGCGWLAMTAIQAAAIPPALLGRSLIGTAKTGSGKTAAYLVPLLQHLAEAPATKPRRPAALVLAPTRELALQVTEVARPLGEPAGLRTATVYGGVGYAHQRKALAAGVDLLVATPGRLIDLRDQGHVLLDSVRIFVLDEADRMLDMGFIEPIESIWKQIPRPHQAMLFSATFPPPIRRLATRLLDDPLELSADPPSTLVETVEQIAMPVAQADKPNLLFALLSGQLRGHELKSAVVFTNSRGVAGRVTRYLQRRGMEVAVMHGGMSQPSRQKVLQSLRDGEVRCLVATDVASRGIDFDALSHVVNVDMPLSVESYVHRIGRTARAGLHGTAITFITPADAQELADLERHTGERLLIDASHPYAVVLPAAGGKRRKSGRDAAAAEAGVELKKERTASGKTRTVEYKAGRRRRTLSGKIRTGRAIRRDDDRFKPAWKKRAAARKKK